MQGLRSVGHKHITVDLVQLATVAAGECVRQQVDEGALIRLLWAHKSALTVAYTPRTTADPWNLPKLSTVLSLGQLIEPSNYAGDVLRDGPVTFADGGSAVHHDRIAPTLARMFTTLDAAVDPDEFTKAFLEVHPFFDGNGRTAWLLYNWLTRQLHAPVPLPDYFGGQP